MTCFKHIQIKYCHQLLLSGENSVPGYPPSHGTPPLARVPPWPGYPPSQGTPLARVPPQPGYPPGQGTPPARVPPTRVPPRLDLAGYPPGCPMAFWEMLQSIMGYGYPSPCGQTDWWMEGQTRVKTLPSRRTMYAGGNYTTTATTCAGNKSF